MTKLATIAIIVLGASVSLFGVTKAAERTPSLTLTAVPVVAVSAAASPGLAVGQKMPASCADQAWPNVSAECLAATSGAPARTVRTIAIR